jgi:hypothetical protein
MSLLLSRRVLVAGAVALVLHPHQSFGADPDKIVNLGWLSSTPGPDPLLDAFRAGLHDLNYVDGRSIRIRARSAQDNADLRTLARELVRQQVDVQQPDRIVGELGDHVNASKNLPVSYSLGLHICCSPSCSRPK